MSSYCAAVRFWANQQCRSEDKLAAADRPRLRARIIRMGAANKLAWVADAVPPGW